MYDMHLRMNVYVFVHYPCIHNITLILQRTGAIFFTLMNLVFSNLSSIELFVREKVIFK